VRLLTQLTRQVAVVQYPSLTRSTVRHVELVLIGPSRVMLVLITNTGRVEQRMVDCPGTVTDALLGDLRSRLNVATVGERLVDAPSAVVDLAEAFAVEDRPMVATIIGALLESLVEHREERVMLGGTANLARFGNDFSFSIQPVLEALEEQVVLLRLLGEVAGPSSLTVRIGHENPEGLTATSVVSVGYGAGEEALARLGVLGPTRMDYPTTIGAVRAVARYVGQIISES
jgi:heat-inducible transcriptional repressor